MSSLLSVPLWLCRLIGPFWITLTSQFIRYTIQVLVCTPFTFKTISVILAWIQWYLGSILLKFWFMLLLWHLVILLNWLATDLGFESPFPPYPKGALGDWDPVTLEATIAQKTHFCVPLINLLLFLICDVVHCLSGRTTIYNYGSPYQQIGTAIVLNWDMWFVTIPR